MKSTLLYQSIYNGFP